MSDYWHALAGERRRWLFTHRIDRGLILANLAARVDKQPVCAGRFGAVKCRIGTAQERPRIVARLHFGEAARDRRGQFIARPSANAIGEYLAAAERGLRHHDDELIVAIAG